MIRHFIHHGMIKLKVSEANLQAEFYHQCRLLNLHCWLELTTPRGRLDVGIFDTSWKRLLAIVECKRWRAINLNSKQMQRYLSIGVPVFGLSSRYDAAPLAKSILSDVTNGLLEGITVEALMSLSRIKRRQQIIAHKAFI